MTSSGFSAPTRVGTAQPALAFSQLKKAAIRLPIQVPMGPRARMVTTPAASRLASGTVKNLTALGEIFCTACSMTDMNHTPSRMGTTEEL